MNNTVKRSLSGVCFLAIVLGGLLVNQYLYALLMTFMVITMLTEFYRMTMGDRYRVSRILATFMGVAMFAAVFSVFAFHVPVKFVSLNFVLLLSLMISSLYARDRSDFKLSAFLYTGLLYIAIPLASSNVVVFDAEGHFNGVLMLAFFCIIWASDVGAYCFGLLFGRNGRKLWPDISPKKSWAGFWGGLAMAVAAAVILCLTGLFTFPMLHCIILSVIMSVAGVYGDLFESQWKRVCGLKDSGNIIPGHGGMLDRFDSALFAIPSGVIYLVIVGLL
ncbi:MAG: phosphatidate cytidylyltransferase [Bacteroidales bacterium]|nr:phosphatidate cytidylyltransferase [Bacteroidales bacterium]